ncbi:MAG: flippase-like domain-containing protein [Ruminococcus sp.]|nr:flippase-like domain-containing protein [Ruminococcus sp.]
MKKLIKTAGNLLVIAAIVFLIKKIIDMDADLSQLASPVMIGALAVNFVIQTFLFVVGCIPWLGFTRALSARKIPFSAAMPVYTKSNIYKYVPGNVFQYVGRNKLAVDMNISHVDVVCATILDILFCVFWTGIIALVLLRGRIAGLLEKYGEQILIVGIAGVILVAAVLIFVRIKFADKLKGYISRYSKAFEKENRKSAMAGIFYYLGSNCVQAVTYFICLRLVIGSAASFGELTVLTGAFMFAWIIGFITPGAPGGIGIREGVMIFVSGAAHQEKIILFVLIMRLASVFADLAAFAVGQIYLSRHKEKNAE